MREVRAWVALARHGLLLIRSGQLRFRLETFGLYYPALPYRSPGWKVSAQPLVLLLRQTRSYAHWLLEMQDLKEAGTRGWWNRRQ